MKGMKFLAHMNTFLIISLTGCAAIVPAKKEAGFPTPPATSGYEMKILRSPEKTEQISSSQLKEGMDVFIYDPKGQLEGPFKATASTAEPGFGWTLTGQTGFRNYPPAKFPTLYVKQPQVIDSLNSERIKQSLIEFVRNIQSILDEMAKLLGNYEVNQFEIGVTVSAEGSIIVVKGEAEAEFRIIFSKKMKK
jgi:hypothetical protein